MRRGALALLLLLSVSSLQPVGAARAVTVDGEFDGTGRVAAGSVTELQVAGRGGVPDDAAAAVLNVTVTEPAAAGYVTVYPCDVDRPNASTVNYLAGDTVPNATIATLAADGRVCLYSSEAAHLIVDVNGYFGASSLMRAVSPARLLDSRSGAISSTIDGRFRAIGTRPARSTTSVDVVGRAGVAATKVVAVNLTVTEPAGPGYATVWQCDRRRPTSSNINFEAGQTIANLVMVPVSSDAGSVCVYTSQTVELVMDLVGYYAVPADTRGQPIRVLDSRIGAVSTTYDGEFDDLGVLPPGTTELQFAGRDSPAMIDLAPGSDLVLNVAITEPSSAGYVSVWPCDEAQPLASNVNFRAGQTIANTVFTTVPASTAICLYTGAATHMVVDLISYAKPNFGFEPVTPARLLDTRPSRPTWMQRSLVEPGLEPPGDIECPTPLRCVVASGDRAEQPYLLVTNDAGLTWSGIATGANEDSFGAIACPTPDDCYVGRAHYSEGLSVAYTHDGGVTWGSTDVSEAPGIAALGPYAFRALACPGPRRCVGSLDGEPNALIETIDGGASWRLVDPSPEYALQSIGCSSTGSCVAAALSGSDPVFVRSTDNGQEWTWVRDLPAGDRWIVECTSSTTCAVASWTWAPGDGDGLLLATDDVGVTWSEHTLPTETIDDLSCLSELACFVIEGSGAGVYRTLDGGATWELRTTVARAGHLLRISCATLDRCTAGTRPAAVVVVGSPP